MCIFPVAVACSDKLFGNVDDCHHLDRVVVVRYSSTNARQGSKLSSRCGTSDIIYCEYRHGVDIDEQFGSSHYDTEFVFG